MKFFKLFTPFKIRNMTISNRIIMPALNLNLANNGFITNKLIKLYNKRVKGEVGMLIIGGCYVDKY
ncbi:MAG: hypothetical protein ACFFDH_08485 [Promethearchaeota archaeon]